MGILGNLRIWVNIVVHKMMKPNQEILFFLVLDSSHTLCMCNNALIYLFIFWFSVIMFKSDI